MSEEALKDEQRDRTQEVSVAEGLHVWRRRMIWFGVALAANGACIVPFLFGYPLHEHFQSVGKPLLVLAGCLLSAFMFSVAITLNFWWYLRDLKNIRANSV
jgi:hypothetical protein